MFILDNDNYIVGIEGSCTTPLPQSINLNTVTGEMTWNGIKHEDTSMLPPLSEISNKEELQRVASLRKLNNTNISIDYEAVDLCDIPKKAKAVFKQISSHIVARNISCVSRKEIMEELNIDRHVLSKAMKGIPKTMMIEKYKDVWHINPYYAFKGDRYRDQYINQWISFITRNRLHCKKQWGEA